MLDNMNISKIQIKGVEYNLTDKEAQNLIAQLQQNTYNKTEVDSLVSAIDDKIEGIDLTAYETKADAATKYQPKGNYLTQHQDISGLATKQEVADAVAGVDVTEQLKDYAKAVDVESTYAKKSELPSEYDDTALTNRVSTLEGIDHTQYLTEHQDISNLATKTEVSGKVDKVSGKGLSTNDYSNADKAKVAATPTFWVGTQAEYDAIATKDNNTFYYITE